jgi:integrase/recombinase XerD
VPARTAKRAMRKVSQDSDFELVNAAFDEADHIGGRTGGIVRQIVKQGLESRDCHLRKGKFGKARLVPVSHCTRMQLADYAKERDRLLGAPSQAFFVSDSGKRLTACGARYNFAAVCQSIGLRPAQKYNRHGHGPRIHDLRHTFAVRTLLNWYRDRAEPGREMVKLTTYLGHANPVNTYWYIEAIPELLELASKRVEEVQP